MSFTDKNKRALIEVINHIYYAYASDDVYIDGDSHTLLLPSRLVHLTAEVLGQTYHPELLNKLDKSNIELLLTSLVNCVDLMHVSLKAIVNSLPPLPAQMVQRVNERIEEMEKIKEGPAPPCEELIDEEGVTDGEVGRLRAEVVQVESLIGPRREKMQQLQFSVKEKSEELRRLELAVSEAEKFLEEHDSKVRTQLDRVIDIGGALSDALESYAARNENRIHEAVETLAEKVSEGRRLKAELEARISEVSEVFAQTTSLSTMLTQYAQANRRVADNVPTVLQVTREKLNRVEEQLQTIDSNLKEALAQHQQSRHAVEVARI